VWAAIDCSGAYAVGPEGRGEPVLGRMAARIARLPREGEECVVVGWPRGADGRKLYAGTALFADGGELLAVARQTWIQPRVS
jgi:predicted amidohydrolase